MIWTRTTDDVVAPTLADPVLRQASDVVGGPVGKRARSGRSRFTPALVVVLIATFVMAVSWVHDSRCLRDDGTLRPDPYTLTHLCYSDLPVTYLSQGFGAGVLPLEPVSWMPDAVQPKNQDAHDALLLRYPVLGATWMLGASAVTHAIGASPDTHSQTLEQANAQHGVQTDAGLFWAVSTVGGFVVLLLGLVLLVRAQRRRPWDAALIAASPLLLLSGQINLDLPAFGFVAGALWAWSKKRPIVAGVLIGLGTAMRLHPVLLLVALLPLCLRGRQMESWVRACAAALTAWLIVDIPVYLASPEQFMAFWDTTITRGTQIGSIWSVLGELGLDWKAPVINRVTALLFVAALLAIGALVLMARRRPRLAQVAFLVMAALLLVNKAYAPQFALWLLPFAALARPRVRDLLIWQAGEAFYFLVVWLHIAGLLIDGDQLDWVYVLAVAVRVLALLWLVVVVVRDIVSPWHDPVRADGISDDPLGGVLDETEEMERARGLVEGDAVEGGGGETYVEGHRVADLGHVDSVGQEDHRRLHVGRLDEPPLLARDRER